MKKHSKGFTLIELMIVIAIIGILSSIAIPAYQDYVARSQASEVLKVSEGLKTDIGLYRWSKGAWPPSGSAVITSAANLSGKYFDAGDLAITPDTGVITTSFRRGANRGKTVVLTPQINSGDNIRWTCSGSISNSRLPSSCQ